ncbi:PREDICTED: copper transporter 6-like [Nelumbo nucifera]|uniref:Copper transport protein n=2 Tax=Nelumbo nucifera TaxID=4432 RepID=A0A1U8AYS7_NELNU|nr:PREDICTED: copper transporter 6-like [Nelumbo nucifera]DAD42931.1 TPA_asm: hypothetical protein HUJ06_001161 [Nelumbo nucifera]
MDHGMGDSGTDTEVSPPQISSDVSSVAMPSQKSMMHGSFFWGKDVEILFSGWPQGELGMYILALFSVFLLAVAVEMLSVWSVKSAGMKAAGTIARVTHTGLYLLRMGLSYLIMLSVMSFNGEVFLVAVAGHAVGFFLFRSLVAHQPQTRLNDKPITTLPISVV